MLRLLRRLSKSLKPLGIALLVVVVALPVAEFTMRLSACRSEMNAEDDHSHVSVVPSWQTHHQLEPLQKIELDEDSDEPSNAGLLPADTESPEQRRAVVFRTSSLGLRGPEIEMPKPPGLFRIICLGDEVLLAPRILEESTLTARLARHLQSVSRLQVEVINAGVPDFCPLLSYLQFRHQLAGLDPDLVIAHFDVSDVWDDRRYRRLTDLGIAEQPLACVNPSLLSKPRARSLSENFMVCRWGKCELESMFESRTSGGSSPSADDPRSKYVWLEKDSVEQTLQVNLTLSAYDHLASWCGRLRIPLLLAMHPAPWQISTTASPQARRPDRNGVFPGTLLDDPRPAEMIRTFARDRNLTLCDVTPAIKSATDPDQLFQWDSRGFSDSGQQVYGAVLANAVVQFVPGPWRLSSDQSAPMQTSWTEQVQQPQWSNPLQQSPAVAAPRILDLRVPEPTEPIDLPLQPLSLKNAERGF